MMSAGVLYLGVYYMDRAISLSIPFITAMRKEVLETNSKEI